MDVMDLYTNINHPALQAGIEDGIPYVKVGSALDEVDLDLWEQILQNQDIIEQGETPTTNSSNPNGGSEPIPSENGNSAVIKWTIPETPKGTEGYSANASKGLNNSSLEPNTALGFSMTHSGVASEVSCSSSKKSTSIEPLFSQAELFYQPQTFDKSTSGMYTLQVAAAATPRSSESRINKHAARSSLEQEDIPSQNPYLLAQNMEKDQQTSSNRAQEVQMNHNPETVKGLEALLHAPEKHLHDQVPAASLRFSRASSQASSPSVKPSSRKRKTSPNDPPDDCSSEIEYKGRASRRTKTGIRAQQSRAIREKINDTVLMKLNNPLLEVTLVEKRSRLENLILWLPGTTVLCRSLYPKTEAEADRFVDNMEPDMKDKYLSYERKMAEETQKREEEAQVSLRLKKQREARKLKVKQQSNSDAATRKIQD